MVCKRCGKELTQEMIKANLCWACGDIIDESSAVDNEISNTTVEEEVNNETNENYDSNNSNLIGSILQFLGILILILGTIGSFILADDGSYYNSFIFSQFVIYEFATILSGFVVIGLAQIVQLLHRINNKLK